jgi:hypothetical protein
MSTLTLALTSLSALALLALPSRPCPAFACVTLAPCCRHQQQPLLPPLTITINSSAQLTTTTTRIHWLSFLIKGSDGSHRCLQRRSMAATAMASLLLPSMTMTMIGTVPLAPSHRQRKPPSPLPLLTAAAADNDRHRRGQ